MTDGSMSLNSSKQSGTYSNHPHFGEDSQGGPLLLQLGTIPHDQHLTQLLKGNDAGSQRGNHVVETKGHVRCGVGMVQNENGNVVVKLATVCLLQALKETRINTNTNISKRHGKI